MKSLTRKLEQAFLRIGGVVLLLSGSLKLLSSLGSAAAIHTSDPLFLVGTRWLFLGVGLLELAAASYCVLGSRPQWKLFWVAWLTFGFVLYRFGLWWLGVRKPCGCLGRVGDWIPWVARYEEGLARAVLVFLIVGVSACLLARLLQRRREVDTGAICSPATR